jgi:hypothetical protein
MTRFADLISRFFVQLDNLYLSDVWSFPTLTLLMKKEQVYETILNPPFITKDLSLFTCHEDFPCYKAEHCMLLYYLLSFSAMAYWTPGQVEACCITSRVLLWLSSYRRVHTTLICEPATLLIPSLSAWHVTFTVNLYTSGFRTISFQNICFMMVCSGCF